MSDRQQERRSREPCERPVPAGCKTGEPDHRLVLVLSLAVAGLVLLAACGTPSPTEAPISAPSDAPTVVSAAGDGHATGANRYHAGRHRNPDADQHAAEPSCNRSTSADPYATTDRTPVPPTDTPPPPTNTPVPPTNTPIPPTARSTDGYAGPTNGHPATSAPVPVAGPGCGHLFQLRPDPAHGPYPGQERGDCGRHLGALLGRWLGWGLDAVNLGGE